MATHWRVATHWLNRGAALSFAAMGKLLPRRCKPKAKGVASAKARRQPKRRAKRQQPKRLYKYVGWRHRSQAWRAQRPGHFFEGRHQNQLDAAKCAAKAMGTTVEQLRLRPQQRPMPTEAKRPAPEARQYKLIYWRAKSALWVVGGRRRGDPSPGSHASQRQQRCWLQRPGRCPLQA